MGMESCFVKLICDDCNLDIDEIVDLLRQKFIISNCKIPSYLFYKKRAVFYNKYVIDKKVIFTIDLIQNSDRIEMSFEWCFCNFENNLKYVYELMKWIDGHLKKSELLIYNNIYSLENMNFMEFRTLVTCAFEKKMQLFEKRYGKNNVDVLPYEFYSWYRRKQLFNIFHR